MFSSLPSLANRAISAGRSLRKRFTTNVFPLNFALYATPKDPLPISTFASISLHWNSLKPSILIFFPGLGFDRGYFKILHYDNHQKRVQRAWANWFMNGVAALHVQFHEWKSVIITSAETHRNPRAHIISFLDYFQEKMSPNQMMEAVYTFIIFFESKKFTQATVKTKIDAWKENQCTTLWLLNGFLSHEMFNGFLSHEMFNGFLSHEMFNGFLSHEMFNGFLSHEMFSLLFRRNEKRVSGRNAKLIIIAI